MIEKRPLWKHQSDAIERAKKADYHALFMDPGVGKTRTMIEILLQKYKKHGSVLPTLILCPPVVISNWASEFAQYSDIPTEKIIQLKGTGNRRTELAYAAKPGSIFITNYESLLISDLMAAIRTKLDKEFSVLVLDESHRVKSPDAKRTREAINISQYTHYRYLLTGTPVLNNLMDIYSQFRILDGGERFGKNFFNFRAKYFYDKNAGMPSQKHFPLWTARARSSDEIKRLIEECASFAHKSECLDLPPLVKKTIDVPLGKEQRRMYDSMKRDLISSIDVPFAGVKHSIAELAITKALRMQQIVSGFMRVEETDGSTETVRIKDNPRKEALKSLLEDLAPNHKVLVWAVFHSNYDDIRDACNDLDIEYAELHGQINDRDDQINRFNTDPKCRVLIGHPGSGGIGVNLVTASYSIFYSRSFSLEFDIQAEARNYRGGSERHESITRIDLCASATIDELVLKSLASKQELSESVLRQKLMEL
jgi:SNF2 family DNA or RNA helicase